MNLRRLYFTQNECYLVGRSIVPRGVMIHSTGANNPKLKRYVGPDDGLLGPSVSHWNTFQPGGRQVCVHAFIGLLAGGSVASYQTLPWTMRGWHCGGTGNNTHIGIELCEDALVDEDYFWSIYREATELTASLCKQYGLDPLENGVVLSHEEGHQIGIASNHADVGHWFSKFGVTMDDFRSDVAKILQKEAHGVTQQEFDAMMENWLARRAEEEASNWAKPILERAMEAGLTDGSRPRSFATREEVATMISASVQ